MHRRESRVLLRHYLEQGVSKTELAKRLGISRPEVYHWIWTGQLDRDLDDQQARYRPRPPVPTQLDPYKPIIPARLEAFPLLTAQRLFEEPQRRLRRRVHEAEGVRATGATVRAGGASGALRDAGGVSGPSGLRNVRQETATSMLLRSSPRTRASRSGARSWAMRSPLPRGQHPWQQLPHA